MATDYPLINTCLFDLMVFVFFPKQELRQGDAMKVLTILCYSQEAITDKQNI